MKESPYDEVDRLRAENARLAGRVDELLARGTELEGERRAWKARARAALRVLQMVAVDAPIVGSIIHGGDVAVLGSEDDVLDLLARFAAFVGREEKP